MAMADITIPTRYTRNTKDNVGKGGPYVNPEKPRTATTELHPMPNPGDGNQRGSSGSFIIDATGPGGKAIEAESALPADRQAAVEQGLALFQITAGERDRLKTQVAELNNTITQQRVEIEALQSLVNMMESRTRDHQIERDQAVAERAAYESLFIVIQAQMRAFQVPNVPLVKAAPEQQQTGGLDEVHTSPAAGVHSGSANN